MYAILIHSFKDSNRGFFASLTIHKGEEYNDKYNGKQRIEPRITLDKSKIKTWKTQDAAKKYANTLSTRLVTIEYIPQLTRPYIYRMRYSIRVIDMSTNDTVYTIDSYEYDSAIG